MALIIKQVYIINLIFTIKYTISIFLKVKNSFIDGTIFHHWQVVMLAWYSSINKLLTIIVWHYFSYLAIWFNMSARLIRCKSISRSIWLFMYPVCAVLFYPSPLAPLRRFPVKLTV